VSRVQTRPTVKDRILLHLNDFEVYEQDHQAPRQVSQEGIASSVGILQKHIAQYIRPMIAGGLVVTRSGYIIGGRQRQKVYFLTVQGKKAAVWIREMARPPLAGSKLQRIPVSGFHPLHR